MESQGNLHMHGDDWHRTVYIDTPGVKTTEFGLSDAKKQKIEESGKKGTHTYFKWYDVSKSKPSNRP